MSETRQLNQDLLVDLDPNTFIGRVLTTTNAEIEEAFNTLVAPTEKKLAAGAVGSLKPLEKALFTQAFLLKKESDRIIEEYNREAALPEFDDQTVRQQREKYEAAEKGANTASVDSGRYHKIGWIMVKQRLGDLGKRELTFHNDGNIYVEIEEDDENFPLCEGCGKRHKGAINAETLTEMFTDFFNGERKEQRAEA